MLKPNSKKLLMWLYPAGGIARRRVAYSQIEVLLSDLTEAGRHSLIRVLHDKQLLFSDDLEGQLHLTISSHGQAELEANFPALKMKQDDWKGDWSMILFLQSPQSDKNFRYLRSLLLNNHCFALKRGVYLRAGELPDSILKTLRGTYTKAAAVVRFNQWEFGEERIIIGQQTNLQDTIDIYSGISIEVNKLLNNFVQFNSMNIQRKNAFNSIFDRLYAALEIDLGLIPKFFEDITDGVDLLHQLQQADKL